MATLVRNSRQALGCPYISGIIVVIGQPGEQLLHLRSDIASLNGVEMSKEVVNQRHLLRQHSLLSVCEEYGQVADCVASRIQQLSAQVSQM